MADCLTPTALASVGARIDAGEGRSRALRVLLLNPNYTLKKDSLGEFSFFPPLGLAYMAALLEGRHDVRILDLNLDLRAGTVPERQLESGHYRYGFTDAEIQAQVRDWQPDIVGVSSIFTPFYADAVRVSRLARDASPGALVVMGGAHASMTYRTVIEEPAVDVVVRGEGEIPFKKLVGAAAAGRSFDGVPGLVWKDPEGGVHDNGMGEQVRNLDDLPLPAYHLLDMGFYTNLKDRNFAYSKQFPIGHMITSRGCPYTCIFCSTRNFFPNYRVHSAVRVIEEIKFLQRTYGVREVHFHDDAFLIQRRRVQEICQDLIDENLGISWQISQGANINLLSRDLLTLAKRSGMYRIGFPIESGSEKTLEYIRKPANLTHARDVIAAANEVGLFTHANFIIGFPNETPAEIQETFDFAATCGVDFLKILVCQPLAGAELYEVYAREGLLDRDGHSSTYTSTEYNTKYFTAEELNRIRRRILLAFQVNRLRRVLSPSGFYRTVYPKVNSRDALAYFGRVFLLALRAMFLRLNAGH